MPNQHPGLHGVTSKVAWALSLLELLALCSATMREGAHAGLLFICLALGGQAGGASAPERYVTVSAEGDFVLGCQRFLVAGWNQHALARKSCNSQC